jgi:hypothetical protein
MVREELSLMASSPLDGVYDEHMRNRSPLNVSEDS